MKKILPFILLLAFVACKKIEPSLENLQPQGISTNTNFPPRKTNLWIFILAGQSNMAGRALIGPEDLQTSPRILTMDESYNWNLAQEPLHFYDPGVAGLDCGLSFGKEFIKGINDTITVGLVPCAIGGTSVEQWLNDSTYRNLNILSNFAVRVALASKSGAIKGILWHQGENNANAIEIRNYKNNLQALFEKFREITQNKNLPICVGELGSYLRKKPCFGSYPDSINLILKQISEVDRNVILTKTGDLTDMGDTLHFDSKSQRLLGKRYAENMKKALGL
jgi:hypothetical protein